MRNSSGVIGLACFLFFVGTVAAADTHGLESDAFVVTSSKTKQSIQSKILFTTKKIVTDGIKFPKKIKCFFKKNKRPPINPISLIQLKSGVTIEGKIIARNAFFVRIKSIEDKQVFEYLNEQIVRIIPKSLEVVSVDAIADAKLTAKNFSNEVLVAAFEDSEEVAGEATMPVVNTVMTKTDFGYEMPVLVKTSYMEVNEDPSVSTKFGDFDIELDFTSGYRIDNLEWSISGDILGSNPNVLSELTWENLNILEMVTNGRITWREKFFVEGMFGYGLITKGDNQDSDYLANGRSFEFSRSNNETNNDDVRDYSFALGYKQKIEHPLPALDTAWMSMLAGFSFHEQHLRMTNGFQTLGGSLGPFGALDSTYQTQWNGPWLGFEFTGIKDRFKGLVRFEYHWADYFAQANWNLRTDLQHPVSFEHTATGRGMILRLGTDYLINKEWSANLRFDMQNWFTNPGLDRVYSIDGRTSTTQLNKVHWNSLAIRGGLTYYFP